MPESPDEKAALERLDEATRDVAWQEEQKEMDRELSTSWSPLGFLRWFGRARPFRRVEGDPVPEPVDDPDPGDEHGLRDTLDKDSAQP